MRKSNSNQFPIFKGLKKYFFLIQILLFPNEMMANNLRNQNIMNKKITISLKNVSLEQAINELAIYAEIKFSYNSRILQMKPKVSIEANKIALSDVLIELLKPYNITYLVINNHIILQKKSSHF